MSTTDTALTMVRRTNWPNSKSVALNTLNSAVRRRLNIAKIDTVSAAALRWASAVSTMNTDGHEWEFNFDRAGNTSKPLYKINSNRTLVVRDSVSTLDPSEQLPDSNTQNLRRCFFVISRDSCCFNCLEQSSSSPALTIYQSRTLFRAGFKTHLFNKAYISLRERSVIRANLHTYTEHNYMHCKLDPI